MEQREKLDIQMKRAGFVLSERQLDQFLLYYQELIEWNQVMNLTAITEFHEVIMKHFLDSLMIGKVYGWEENIKIRILDLGTGAGFPGIPIRILYPQTEIILMDSLNKRVRFLDSIIQKLKLSNLTAIHGRAEEMGRKEDYRQQFDLCVSRAVANLSTLTEYCMPFVKAGGHFISYKSGNIEEELKNAKNAIYLLGGKLEGAEKFELLDSGMERSLISIKKVKSTDKKYPRQGGKPSKEPL